MGLSLQRESGLKFAHWYTILNIPVGLSLQRESGLKSYLQYPAFDIGSVSPCRGRVD